MEKIVISVCRSHSENKRYLWGISKIGSVTAYDTFVLPCVNLAIRKPKISNPRMNDNAIRT